MSNIIEVTRNDLQNREVPDGVLESVPMYIRRAIISLHNEGAMPPRIWDFKVGDEKEEKRDGHDNLIYNFIFLPDDFLRLDKFTVYNVDTEDNKTESVYQRVASDLLFKGRREADDRNFFSITDYNVKDERTRKIISLDPFPEDEEYIEIRYFTDGTVTPLENLNQRYWEGIISKVHEILGLKSTAEAERVISKESANWRNQEGKDTYNDTMHTTSVNNGLFGKTR